MDDLLCGRRGRLEGGAGGAAAPKWTRNSIVEARIKRKNKGNKEEGTKRTQLPCPLCFL
jgi:hypothetical protein